VFGCVSGAVEFVDGFKVNGYCGYGAVQLFGFPLIIQFPVESGEWRGVLS
jgi:Cys-tRNA synthase (O-phospho-L-seryl-tRNA:Cys-tRNA synthase)